MARGREEHVGVDAGSPGLTVACVFSKSETYDASHVSRLEDMVAKHLDIPYRFVCLNDSPWPGWWGKISLFEPGRFTGRVLYLDLDVTVVGPLREIVEFDAPFAGIKDWLRPTINSSVMVWDAGVADHVHTAFRESVMDRLHGDQDWITEQMPDIAYFPREWCVSYRKHVMPFGVVKHTARVVVFHGKPKSWEVPEVARRGNN